MAKKLKVGIVGAGGIWKSHVPGWQASADAKLVAIADLIPENLKRAGEMTGAERLYTKAEDLFADPDIDIVDICTANRFHAPLAIAALGAGKHVLCEKPLAPTPEDVRRMIAARDRSGKLLMTAQNYRFEASSRALKTEIDDGLLGEVYHARCWALRRSGCSVRPSFVSKQHSGGGPCIDIGVHILDLGLWLMGNPRPVTISGATQDKLRRNPGAFVGAGRAIPDCWDVEEFAAGFVRFENGATLILETSWILHHDDSGGDTHLWLYGTQAGAHWPANKIVGTNYRTKQYRDITLPYEPGMEAHAAECVAFADAVAHGKPSPVPAEQSLDVIAILDGIYRAAASGREVAIEH